MDSSSSTSPPSPLDPQESDSSPQFPLLDGRVFFFLKLILQKMGPAALATVRESSYTMEGFLMEEALRRNLLAEATFMRRDVVQYRGVTRHSSQKIQMSAFLTLTNDSVGIQRKHFGISSTSLLFHNKCSDCSCSRESYEFWKTHIRNITASTAMSHLAGSRVAIALAKELSDAETVLARLRPYKISVELLAVIDCSRTAIYQLINHLRPARFTIEPVDTEERFKESEEIVHELIDLGTLSGILFISKIEYPKHIVEHFLHRCQRGETVLRRLTVLFPPDNLPGNRVITLGIKPFTLKLSYRNVWGGIENEWTLLMRTDSSPPRHILLVGGIYACRVPSVYKLMYQHISDADDLLNEMFSYAGCSSGDPHLVYRSVSDYSPSQIRDIFNSLNWPA